MGNEAYDHMFKLLLTGDSGVGKTSFLLRFVDDSFKPDVPSSIGVDFKVKALKVREKKIKLTIWDTAGQERFRTLTSSYYRGAHGVILMYDVTRKDTLHESLASWIKEIRMYCGKTGVSLLLVGNKIDRDDSREVSHTDGVAFAKDNGMLFIEVSAKTRAGITQAVEVLVGKILDSPQMRALALDKDAQGLQVGEGATEGSGCC